MTSWLGRKRPREWTQFFHDHQKKVNVKNRGGGMRPIHPDETKKMTQLEARYAQHLELLRIANEILDWRFEPMKLRLSARTFYTPDFLVVFPEYFAFHETKGHWEDDARVKWKVAAELFPWFRFAAVTEEKGRHGAWQYEYFGGKYG